MPSVRVKLVSTNNQDRSVTLLVEGKRIEYFLGDKYHFKVKAIGNWLDSSWNNYVVANLTHWAEQILVEGQSFQKKDWSKMSTSIEHQKTPSKEFSFTVIAPIAKTMHYAEERKWFKTEEDALQYAASIYDNCGERKSFDLCIVQCKDIVAPKPQVELTSRW